MDLAAGFSKELRGQYLGPQQRIAAQHLQWQLQWQWQLLHLLPCARCCTLWKRSSSLTDEHPMWSVAAWEKHNLSHGCLCALCRERSNFGGAALGSCCGQHKTSRKHEPSGVSTLPLYGEPGCWVHVGLLPGQELDVEGLLGEECSYRAQASSGWKVAAEEGDEFYTVNRDWEMYFWGLSELWFLFPKQCPSCQPRSIWKRWCWEVEPGGRGDQGRIAFILTMKIVYRQEHNQISKVKARIWSLVIWTHTETLQDQSCIWFPASVRLCGTLPAAVLVYLCWRSCVHLSAMLVLATRQYCKADVLHCALGHGGIGPQFCRVLFLSS